MRIINKRKPIYRHEAPAIHVARSARRSAGTPLYRVLDDIKMLAIEAKVMSLNEGLKKQQQLDRLATEFPSQDGSSHA